MSELELGQRAFSSFRVLNGEDSQTGRDQLFRSMAQLFSYVSDRCDDEQVAQYDDVLCQLAELVEVEARTHVASLLAPLERAPGTVVVKLAHDVIEVAKPLLEFSNVLSDDDLIEIVSTQSEAHREAIAGRPHVAERVGGAIVDHGDRSSLGRLVRNTSAEFDETTLGKLVRLSEQDAELATDLRNRPDIDWVSLRGQIDQASGKLVQALADKEQPIDPVAVGQVNAVVYNRMRNRAGFSAKEWTLALNQVKALSDRKQLDERALLRFARFSYGHHAAAALGIMLRIKPEVMVKWLASQDYVAITVALRALELTPDLFSAIVAVLPWRDLPSEGEQRMVRARFEALETDEAFDIFDLWRTHAFRKRGAAAAEAEVA